MSVCLSVTQHLTSPMFVRLTNDTTYLTGNEGQKICAVFSENAPLQSYIERFRLVRMRRPSPSISGALAHGTAAITPRVCTLYIV